MHAVSSVQAASVAPSQHVLPASAEPATPLWLTTAGLPPLTGDSTCGACPTSFFAMPNNAQFTNGIYPMSQVSCSTLAAFPGAPDEVDEVLPAAHMCVCWMVPCNGKHTVQLELHPRSTCMLSSCRLILQMPRSLHPPQPPTHPPPTHLLPTHLLAQCKSLAELNAIASTAFGATYVDSVWKPSMPVVGCSEVGTDLMCQRCVAGSSLLPPLPGQKRYRVSGRVGRECLRDHRLLGLPAC